MKADQPGIVYRFDDGIREISREGQGRIGPMQIRKRESTQSDPDDPLPKLEIPGRRELQQPDCGEELPAFACEKHGHPIYIGRTCKSPVCRRCWAASVKDSAIQAAAKVEQQRYENYSGRNDIHAHHIVCSPPHGFAVDSEQPIERALLILKELLRENWGIDNFYAVYHPYRIKKEYRKDVYDHGGEKGEGEMRWKDVLNSDNWEEFVKFEPHFHVFCVSHYFDKVVSEAVYKQSGWVFHRIERRDKISVRNIEDLSRQITYTLSHCGVSVDETGKSEKITRYKGSIHNLTPHPEAVSKATKAVKEAAPKLLGVGFADSDGTCNHEISSNEECNHNHDLEDPRRAGNPQVGWQKRSSSTSSSPDSKPWGQWGDTTGWSSEISSSTSVDGRDQEDVDGRDQEDGEAETCDGKIIPIAQAAELLEDDDWREQADHVEGLEVAVREWKSWLEETNEGADDHAPPPPGDDDDRLFLR